MVCIPSYSIWKLSFPCCQEYWWSNTYCFKGSNMYNHSSLFKSILQACKTFVRKENQNQEEKTNPIAPILWSRFPILLLLKCITNIAVIQGIDWCQQIISLRINYTLYLLKEEMNYNHTIRRNCANFKIYFFALKQ